MKTAVTLMLLGAALAVPAAPAAAPVPFAAEFLGSFEYLLFTGHLVPEWRWAAAGFGGGDLLPASYARAGSGASFATTAMEGPCTTLPHTHLTWSVEQESWRGEYVSFHLQGTLCPATEPAPGLAGGGTMEVTGGTGRFAGATGGGTWSFHGQAQRPWFYLLHDLIWNYAGVAGDARLDIAGNLALR